MSRQVAEHRHPLYRRQRLITDQVTLPGHPGQPPPAQPAVGQHPGAIEHLDQPALDPAVCGHDRSPRRDLGEPGQLLAQAADRDWGLANWSWDLGFG
jgi:hypothetical protein